MGLHLHDDFAAIHWDLDPIIDGWQFIGGKFDIDHGSNDLYDLPFCHFLFSLARLLKNMLICCVSLTLRHCDVRQSTPHSSGFRAGLASERF